MEIKYETVRKLCIIAEAFARTESNPDAVHDWFLGKDGTLVPDPLRSDPGARPLTIDEFADRAYSRWNKD